MIVNCEFYHHRMPGMFVVFIDHKPLEHLMNMGLSDINNKRIMRIAENIAWSFFQVQYLPGSRNTVTDLLSRSPSDKQKPEDMSSLQTG